MDQLQLNQTVQNLIRYNFLEKIIFLLAIFTLFLNVAQLIFELSSSDFFGFLGLGGVVEWSAISFVSSPIFFLFLYILIRRHCNFSKKNQKTYDTFKALYKTSRNRRLYESLKQYLKFEKPRHVSNPNLTLILGLSAFFISGFYLILF